MKKFIIYIIGLAIVLLIALNLFIFYTNSSLSHTLDNSDNLRNTIEELDSFKTTITDMSDAQESYIITGNSKYKAEYETSLQSAYTNATALLSNNILSNEDKNTITDLIKDYDTINKTIFNSPLSYPASNAFESLVENSNNAKLKILHSVSNLISDHRNSLEKSSTTISKSITTQKSFVHWISSIFTALIAVPSLFFKKLFKNTDNISTAITSLFTSNNSNSDTTNNTSSTPSTPISTLETFFNFKNDVDGLKYVREKLIENSTFVNYFNVIEYNNSKIQEQYSQYKTKLDSIIKDFIEIEKTNGDVSKLKDDLNDLSIEFENLCNEIDYMNNLSKLLLNSSNSK